VNILLVGAGAVGQVFGAYLGEAGARVTFEVKARHLDAARAGFVLYRRGKGGRGGAGGRRGVGDTGLPSSPPWRFNDFDLRTADDALLNESYDQIWLCTSSQDLRNPWLDALAAHSGNATIVSLQPDMDDRAYLIERFTEARLVQGLIGFLSYQTELPGEVDPEPGVAYWLPPGLATDFDGEPSRVREVVETLGRAGFPARVRANIPNTSALRSATTMPVVAALECAGWSLDALLGARKNAEGLGRGVAASREALAIVDAVLGTRSGLQRMTMRASLARIALALAPKLTPFDLEAYLEFHFKKTAPQTRFLLDTWISHAGTRGLACESLVELRSALD